MALLTESTTFTKDVLGRYICSTWDEAVANPEAIDAVVIGAGMYGSYCAAKIYELSRQRFQAPHKPLRVLVLDAGPFVLPEHTQDVPNLGFFDPGITSPINVGAGSNPGPRNEVWGVGWRSNQPFVGQAYCVGGKGVFWGGWCPRLQAGDLIDWPGEIEDYLLKVDPVNPVGRRPIDHKDLVTGQLLSRGDALNAYEALEYEIGVLPVDDFVFDPVQLSGAATRKVGLNEALRVWLDKEKGVISPQITEVLPAPIAVQTQSFISGLFGLDKYSSVPALTAAVRADHGDGRENDLRMTVIPNTHVQGLGFQTDNEAPERGTRVVNRIDVRVGGANRQLFIAPHCQIVLAMSCIESTRLALQSFSLAGSGLRAGDDELIGRNFMIHLRADIAFDIDRAQFGEWVKLRWPGNELADVLQLAALHIQCKGAFGQYQYQLFAATNNNGPDANMYRMVPDLDLQRVIANEFQSDKIRIVLRASGEVEGGRKEKLRDAKFDYIDLAGPGDTDTEFGHPRAWVQFNRGQHLDDQIWQDMHDTGHAIARALSGGKPLIYRQDLRGSTDYTLETLKRQQGVGTTFHDSGTLWMGDNPDDSVTDANGHFHHVTNAYGCDQALFTTVGSANPVLTGLCLARKVAENIVDRHSDVSRPVTLPGLSARSLLSVTGWKTAGRGQMLELDSANGGLIETAPAGIGLYYLPQNFSDFDMAVEWKAFRGGGAANSGILLRIPDPAGFNFDDSAQFDAFYDAATEIQIDDQGKQFFKESNRATFGNSRFKTGAIYGVAPARSWAASVASPDGDGLGDRYWNTYEIGARGAKIRVVLNGKLVCEADVPSGKRSNGFLGFQFHTGRVQFRNLRLG